MNEEFDNVVENTTENTEAQTVEEMENGIELVDTTDTEESEDSSVEEKEEDTSEKQGRFVTDEELNEIVNRRVARKMSKLERENQERISKYEDTENVLRTTLNVKDDEDVNLALRAAYKEQGIELPEPVKPGLSQHQVEILAKDYANQIIDEGHDSMVEEAERLAKIGYNNLDEKDKIVFTTLAERLTEDKNKEELFKLGVSEAFINDEDFTEFRKKFNSNVPIKDVYELYKSVQPKKKFEKPGSMKGSKEETKKTFYTDEEISKLTSEDLDNPEVWDAVRRSMTSKH